MIIKAKFYDSELHNVSENHDHLAAIYSLLTRLNIVNRLVRTGAIPSYILGTYTGKLSKFVKAMHKLGIHYIIESIDSDDGTSKESKALRKQYKTDKILVKYDWRYLHQVENQTEKLVKIAVKENGMALQYAQSIYCTPEIIRLALSTNGMAICFIDDQTPEFCEIAINQNSFAIVHIKNPTEALRKLAAKVKIREDEVSAAIREHLDKEDEWFYDLFKSGREVENNE